MKRQYLRAVACVGLALVCASPLAAANLPSSDSVSATTDMADHRYYYLDSWTGAIGFPDDPFKSLIDADGTFWTEQGKTASRQGIYPLAVYESLLKIHSDLIGAHAYPSQLHTSDKAM
jgi:hypothetical protein